MERAGRWVAQAINELSPAMNASCPNELAMRTMMAMIRLSNAFEEAGLRNIEVLLSCEKEADKSAPEKPELFPGSGPIRDVFELILGQMTLMTWKNGAGERKSVPLGEMKSLLPDRVGDDPEGVVYRQEATVA
jgi:hypothetical protein